VVDVEEPYPIIDGIELPPSKAEAARRKKEKQVSSARFDNMSDKLRRLFSTPSLMKDEDLEVYAELWLLVEEVVQPKNVCDQMMVVDITHHFWEQQRYRRCIVTVISSKRRAALKRILHETIGLNDVDTETAADTYFGVERLEEREVTDYSTQVRIPKTRGEVVALLEKHGFDESAFERIVMATSVDTLADLQSLALKHEIRREATYRILERRQKKRYEESHRSQPTTDQQGSRSRQAPVGETDRAATVTSLKQIAANRRNATRSTGPVTAQGKARASGNARRHGLSVPVCRGSAVAAADIGEFALQLVGASASRTEIDLARAAAEAQLELVRIRREKQLLLEVLMSVPSPDMQAIKRLDRYERRATSRRKRALTDLSQLCQLPIFR
jgi:hypothetical protein